MGNGWYPALHNNKAGLQFINMGLISQVFVETFWGNR